MTRGALFCRLTPAVLIAGGALALHELRYLVVYGDRSGEALASTGHHYLGLITPLAVAALVLTLRPGVGLLGRVRPDRSPVQPGLAALWSLSTSAILVIYAAQEWLEGKLSQGHPAGMEAIVGNGGWSAVLLAAAVGAVVALAMRGAREAAPVAVAVALACARSARAPCRLVALAPLRARPALDPVACFLAGRGPPPASA